MDDYPQDGLTVHKFFVRLFTDPLRLVRNKGENDSNQSESASANLSKLCGFNLRIRHAGSSHGVVKLLVFLPCHGKQRKHLFRYL